MVVRWTMPAAVSIAVVCTVAISCWPSVLRTMSRPLDERRVAEGALAVARERRCGWWRSATSPGCDSACALASAAASAAIDLTGARAWAASISMRSKLTAPDFERLARMPWPIASLASSGIKALSSALARSCSRKACACGAEDPGKLRPGIRGAHVDDPYRLDARPRRLDDEQVRGFAGLARSARTSFRPRSGVLR